MADETIETTDYVYDSISDYAKRLAAVNQGIRFTDIKGKPYAEVNQRILAFWALFPNGRIVTRKVFDDGNRADFECEVYRDASDELFAVNGHSFEERNSNINKTSYIENAETSAIGRALGMLGIGATTAIASADEVLNAIALQESTKDNATPRQGNGGTNTQGRGKAPQKRPEDPRKQTYARIAGLKMKAMELGADEADIDDWFRNNFGDVALNRLADDQLRKLEGFLNTLIETCKQNGGAE